MNVIELLEAEALALPRDAISEQTALRINASRDFFLEFPSPANDFQYQIQCLTKVGYIPIDPDTMVRVSPKVPISNLFGMLELAYNLKSFKFFDGTVGIESINEVFENLASILASRILQRVRTGLHGEYVEYERDLPVVRGRIDALRTVRLLAIGGSSVSCQYEDHTRDIDDNQILLGTLQVVAKLDFQRPDVKLLVDKARRALAGTITPRRIEPVECINRLYSRLNDDYAPMHGLCRFFLEHAGPGIDRGASDLLPFVVDMPRLFETFVERWLRLHTPESILFTGQHIAKLDANKNLNFTIDIVMADRETRQPKAVIDTKYKRDDTPSESDIQQVVSYAVQMGVNKAFLVYPRKLPDPMIGRVGHVTVEALAIDLSANIEDAAEQLLQDLMARIE